MCKLVFLTSIVLFGSCASSKYVYNYESTEYDKTDHSATSNKINETSRIRSEDLSASLELVTNETSTVTVDTTIVSQNDSLSRQEQDTKSNIKYQKEVKKKLSEERKKADREARNVYPAAKNKRLDAFAVAGAILVTAATIFFEYPMAFAVLGFLGISASIVGLKSRVWGLALASLISAGVILTTIIVLNAIYGPGE